MRETHLPQLLGVRNYLKNYFAMYTRLTRSSVRVELAPPPPPLLEVKNYSNNNFALYTSSRHSSECAELVSPAYMGLGII